MSLQEAYRNKQTNLTERKAAELYEYLNSKYFAVEQPEHASEVHKSLLEYLDAVSPLYGKLPTLEASLGTALNTLDGAIKSGNASVVKEAYADFAQLCAATSTIFRCKPDNIQLALTETKLNKVVLGEATAKAITDRLVPLCYLDVDGFIKEYKALTAEDQAKLAAAPAVKYPMMLARANNK